jgi:SRSO17 transposase
VGHYYSASVGRFVNSQLGVFVAYQVAGRPVTFVDRKLYMPARSGSPGGRPVTKAGLALEMLARARRRQLPSSWVAGGDVFGGDAALRKWLEQHGVAYVLGVPPALGSLTTQDRESVSRRISDLMNLRGDSWYRPRNDRPTLDLFSAEWARLPLHSAPNSQHARSLLLRRAKRVRNLACFVCNSPRDTSLAQLVAVAETQPAMEEAFQTARRWAGLDQYQGKRPGIGTSLWPWWLTPSWRQPCWTRRTSRSRRSVHPL